MGAKGQDHNISSHKEGVIIFNRAVKWSNEEVKEVVRVGRKAHAGYPSSKTAVGSEEYANARKEV